MQKHTKKTIKTIAIIIICFVLFITYLFWLRYSHEKTMRRKGDIGCFVGEGACGPIEMTKEEFIKEMNHLGLSKEKIFQRTTSAKKMGGNMCRKR